MSGTLRLSAREFLYLGLISASALLLRLIWLQFSTAIEPDGYFYATLGRHLAQADLARGMSLYWPPFYPLMVAAASWLFEDLELAGRMVSVVTGSLLVFPEYLLIRGISGRRTAYVGAALLVFQPQLLNGTTELLSDVPFALLFVSAVLTGMIAIFEQRAGAFVATGMLLGASYLTRPEAFGFALLFLALMTVIPRLTKPVGSRRYAAGLLLFLAGFGVMALPYVSYLRVESGRWTISAKFDAHLLSGDFNWRHLMEDGGVTHADLYYGDHRPEKPPESPETPQAPGESVVRPPGRSLTSRATQLVNRFFSQYLDVVPRVFPPLVLLLAGIGVLTGEKTRLRALQECYLLSFLIAGLLGYSIITSSPRYLIPFVPLVYFWVANGLVKVAERAEAVIPGARWVRLVSLPLLLLLLAGSMVKEITYPVRHGRWHDPYEMRLAGNWIKERSDEPPVLIANSPVVAFYAEAERCYYLPDASPNVMIAHAARLGVDYLIVDERKMEERGLKYQRALLEDAELPAGLRVVFEVDEAPGAKVRVFELVDRPHEPPGVTP